jgi:60 kDa SS-A/Ro ribonucleoprotein
MTKYNTKTTAVPVVHPTTTLQGGQGFTQKPEKELVGLLSTGLSNTFYEKEGEREKRFREVFNTVAKKDKLFAAKALIYARTVFGQRSVTHYGAVELLAHLSGSDLGKKFFSKRDRKVNRGGIIYRMDDMNEILACYLAKNGVNASIPNSIKKGFKDAIENSDAYQLAKYQMKGKGVSLVDIVNLVHPTETKVNGLVKTTYEAIERATKGTKWEGKSIVASQEEGTGAPMIPALKALMLGLLKQFDTVEDKNTDAGKTVAAKLKSGEITKEQATTQLNEAKTDNYVELIKEKKIGYLALLRNVRNILKTNDTALLDMACQLLVDEKFIIKSKVFPHQIDLALEIMLNEFDGRTLAKVASALGLAYERSIPNLAELFNDGTTAVVLDVSGSMSTQIRLSDKANGHASALDKGSLIAATLAKGIGANLYVFANSCSKVAFNPLDSINTVKNNLKHGTGVGGGTSWSTIFPVLEREGKFDRVFIISDEQGADQVESSYKSYCNKFGTPNVYVINMCGYGPTMMKENTRVHRLYGYSADIYESAKRVELDVNAVISEINKIEI